MSRQISSPQGFAVESAHGIVGWEQQTRAPDAREKRVGRFGYQAFDLVIAQGSLLSCAGMRWKNRSPSLTKRIAASRNESANVDKVLASVNKPLCLYVVLV